MWRSKGLEACAGGAAKELAGTEDVKCVELMKARAQPPWKFDKTPNDHHYRPSCRHEL